MISECERRGNAGQRGSGTSERGAYTAPTSWGAHEPLRRLGRNLCYFGGPNMHDPKPPRCSVWRTGPSSSRVHLGLHLQCESDRVSESDVWCQVWKSSEDTVGQAVAELIFKGKRRERLEDQNDRPAMVSGWSGFIGLTLFVDNHESIAALS